MGTYIETRRPVSFVYNKMKHIFISNSLVLDSPRKDRCIPFVWSLKEL